MEWHTFHPVATVKTIDSKFGNNNTMRSITRYSTLTPYCEETMGIKICGKYCAFKHVTVKLSESVKLRHSVIWGTIVSDIYATFQAPNFDGKLRS
jgi:hypothetical protein